MKIGRVEIVKTDIGMDKCEYLIYLLTIKGSRLFKGDDFLVIEPDVRSVLLQLCLSSACTAGSFLLLGYSLALSLLALFLGTIWMKVNIQNLISIFHWGIMGNRVYSHCQREIRFCKLTGCSLPGMQGFSDAYWEAEGRRRELDSKSDSKPD